MLLASISCGSGGDSSSKENPVPSITSIYPFIAPEGSRSLDLTVSGSGFVSSSLIQWNGSSRTTVFVNSRLLRMTLSGADLASAGTALITVQTPGPGGGTSSAAAFIIATVDPLSILTGALPNASHKKNYSYTLQASGGIAPYAWSLISGTLPDGLSLSGSGTLTGAPSSVPVDTYATFAIQVDDSAYTPRTAIQAFTVLVKAGDLGRNDACPSTTSAISNGVLRASISPYGDVDVYSFHGTAGDLITAQIYAQRLELSAGSTAQDVFMNSFLELLDADCNRIAYSDDIFPDIITDSTITSYALPSTGTYFLRISDMRGDGRPDFIYELQLSGAH